MSLVRIPARLKFEHACEQQHSSRVFTTSYWLALYTPSKQERYGIEAAPCLTMNSVTALVTSHNTKGSGPPSICFDFKKGTVLVFRHGVTLDDAIGFHDVV